MHDKSIPRVLQELASSKQGLLAVEVSKRQEKFGLNELKKKSGKNPFVLFFNQFKSFIIYILLFAVVVAILSGEVIDAVIILIILLFNAIFGFIQEYKAEKAIDALKKLSGLSITVLRGGKRVKIPTLEIVPGDIILLEEGVKIPADARLIDVTQLRISESSLTGESVPVSKHTNLLATKTVLAERKNLIYSGTIVTGGKGIAVVTATGMQTEIGKIADLLSGVQDEMTPLQKKLESLGKKIGIGTIIVCVMVFVTGVYTEGIYQAFLEHGLLEFIVQSKEWLLTAVSLAVAAVPEGLPAIVTIALAIGIRRMVQKNALIRKLPSVETLGEATIICSDKTGTLTKNEMTVRVTYATKARTITDSFKPTTQEKLLFQIGLLCNDARIEGGVMHGDPTEGALLFSAYKAGMSKTLSQTWKRVDEIPFNSISKTMTTVHKVPKSTKKVVYMKGAPEQVLTACTHILVNNVKKKLTPALKRKILNQNKEFALEAYRVLGFAQKPWAAKGKIDKDLTFVGLQGMIDPPHEEVPAAIARCHAAGIRVIMITGDNKYTAQGIAKEVGIISGAIDGTNFAKLSEKKQIAVLKKTSIFARVEPAHKMRIVELLQQQGEIVAMTGDGVNDAPAIKKANLGIAMGITGTDVAKEASDMVLQDDNFTTIVNAIEEGRGIYENIRKFVNFLLSSNIGEVLVIFFALVLGWPLPMTAVMLLWLNLVTDGLPALALSVDPNPKDLMSRPPKSPKEGIMNKSMTFNVMYVAVLITLGVLGIYKYALSAGFSLEHAQTIAFTTLVMLELARLQAIRSEYKLGVFSNKYLVLAVGGSILLQLSILYTPLYKLFGTVPLGIYEWLWILIVTFIVATFTMVGVKIKGLLFVD